MEYYLLCDFFSNTKQNESIRFNPNQKEDRFGLVLFNTPYIVLQEAHFVSNKNLDKLKKKINKIHANDGTQLQVKYTQTIEMLNIDLVNNHSGNNSDNNNGINDNFYSNPVILLTDMIPNTTGNIGDPDLCKNCANNNDIHTTFIKMGINFKGCNYYNVKTSDKLQRYMIDEFDFMVTPIIFDLKLVLKLNGRKFMLNGLSLW